MIRKQFTAALVALMSCVVIATDYYWIGGAGGSWTDGGCWSLTEGGTSAGACPSNVDSDNAFISEPATIELIAESSVKSVRIDTNVIFKTTTTDEKGYLRFYTMYGDGVVTMSDAIFRTANKNTDSVISNHVVAAAETTNKILIPYDNNRMVFRNGVSGSGNFDIQETNPLYYGYQMYGDCQNFTGTMIERMVGTKNQGSQTEYGSYLSVSPYASYTFDTRSNPSMAFPFKYTDSNYVVVGALNGTINHRRNNSDYGSKTFVIGGINEDCSFGGALGYGDNSWECSLIKVGTAELEFTGQYLNRLTLSNGVFRVGGAESMPRTIVFAGGSMKMAALSGADTTKLDASSHIKNSTATIEFDDEGKSRDWSSTDFAAANPKVGLTKRGTGTLTIANRQNFAGPLTIVSGKIGLATAASGDLETLLSWETGEEEPTVDDFYVNQTALPSVLSVVITNTATRSFLAVARTTALTFTWTGKAGDLAWNNLNNWTVNGSVPVYYPQAKDTVVISDSIVPTLDMSPEFDTSSGSKVLVAVYSKNDFYWTGAAGDGAWSNLNNWSYGSGAAVPELPGTGDNIIFPASLGDGATVTLTANVNATTCSRMTIDCNLLVIGTTGTPDFYVPPTVDGVGVLTIENIRLRRDAQQEFDLQVDVRVDGAATIFARGAGGRGYLSGRLLGGGELTLAGDNGNHSEIRGDMSAFTGKLICSYFVYFRASVSLGGADAMDLSQATVEVKSVNYNGEIRTLRIESDSTNQVLKIGALTGNGVLYNGMASGAILEVGGNSVDASFSGSFSNATDGAWEIRKIGAAKQAIDNPLVGMDVELDGGRLELPYAVELGEVVCNDGKFVMAIPYVDWSGHSAVVMTGVFAANSMTRSNFEFTHYYSGDPTYETSFTCAENEASVFVGSDPVSYVWVGGAYGEWNDVNNWAEIRSSGQQTATTVPVEGDTVAVNYPAKIVVERNQSLARVASGYTNVTFYTALTADGVYDLDFGVNELTPSKVQAAGPFDFAYDDDESSENYGTYSAKRVKGDFVWNGVSSTRWNNCYSWLVNDGPTVVLPVITDSVEFPVRESGAWQVTVETGAVATNIVVNGATELIGTVASKPYDNSACSLIHTYSVTGEGTLTLGDNAGFTMKNSGDKLSVECPLVISAAEDKPAGIRGRWQSKGGTSYATSATISGSVSGSGSFYMVGVRSSSRVSGDMTAFSGSMQTYGDLIERSNPQIASSGALARYNVTNYIASGYGFLNPQGADYEFGELSGNFGTELVDWTINSTYTYTIGARNTDFTLNGTFFSITSSSNYRDKLNNYGAIFRKVGTGTMTFGGQRVHGYDISEGKMLFTANACFYTSALTTPYASELKFSGGEIELADAVKLDISTNIVNSAGATIVVSSTSSRTWKKALAASNADSAGKGAITFKGSGTLTLAAAPAWTGGTTVTVTGGKLKLPAGTAVTLGENTAKADDEGDGYDTYILNSKSLSAARMLSAPVVTAPESSMIYFQ